MPNNDWNFGSSSNDGFDSWDVTPQVSPEQQRTAPDINRGFQPEPTEVQKLKGPWYWPLTIVAFLIVGGLSFLMAYLTKDVEERNPWLMGLIFSVPMAAMFLGSLLLEYRTCAMTPSYLRKSQAIIAVVAVLATLCVGALCDLIYLQSFVVPVKQQTVFVLDKSRSMMDDEYYGYRNTEMITAMEKIIPSMNQNEEVGLVLFGSNVSNQLPIAPLSKNQHGDAILTMIRNTTPSGGTNFKDALQCAIDMVVARGSNQPTQIIFLTDGESSLASETILSMKDQCQALNITIHGVAFSADGKLTSIQTLIGATGGKTVQANDMNQLVEVMVVLTKNDNDLLRSQDHEANLITGIMFGLEGIVIGVGLWLMLSVHGQRRAQMIISPIMGMMGFVLLKYMGFHAELEYWWAIEGAAFTLLGIVFMTKNRLLGNEGDMPQDQQNQGQQQQQPQKPKEELNLPDLDF